MPENLTTKLKDYLRLDDDIPETETEFLKLFLAAAKSSAAEAGIQASAHDNPLYELLLLSLAAHWYTNRGVQTHASAKQLPLSAIWIIGQLRGKKNG